MQWTLAVPNSEIKYVSNALLDFISIESEGVP